MTGYEIKKRVGTALTSVTHASYGTLYPTLHRLLEEGAVHMEEQQQSNRPVRKVYRITARGQQELDAWLHEPAENDRVTREFLLKLFLAGELPAESIKHLLVHRRTATETQLAAMQQTHHDLNGNLSMTQQWVQDYTIELCRVELRWLNRLIAQIEAPAVPATHSEQ